jgi:ankyrin repeat protein
MSKYQFGLAAGAAALTGSVAITTSGVSQQDVAKFLLASNANVNAGNRFGETPRRVAARGAWRNCCWPTRLNTKDNDGATPLLWTARNGHKDIVELLAYDSDINAKNNEGETALHCSARNGYEDMAVFMNQHGGNANLKPNIAHDRFASMELFVKQS